MSGAIAVFVKTPQFSPVKTRLAATLGQKNAIAFYLASFSSVLSVIQSLDKVQNYYAIAEKLALKHKYWQDLPGLWQGYGGLGTRMRHIYQTLLAKHDFVILLGADTPQITKQELLVACAWLSSQHPGFAFGPSVDGGFWLFGGNRDIPHLLWTKVKYSAVDTGIQFFNKIKPLGKIKTLASLCDVDESKDLILLRQALINLTKPFPAQQAMLDFLQSLPIKFFA